MCCRARLALPLLPDRCRRRQRGPGRGPAAARVGLIVLGLAHALGLALAAPAARADAGLVVMAGLRAGSGFESANGGSEDLRLRSGAAGSLAFEWRLDESRHVQLLVSHQRTRLALGPAAAPGTGDRMPLQVSHLHVGGVNYFEGPAGAGPYVIGGLGVTQMTPNLPGTSSRTRASLNVGFGHEWALARSLSLRAELRAYVVAIGSEGAFFCSGGCTVAIRADTLTQAEAAVGLRLAF